MECCKWEELGLLYSSGELDETHTREFEEHLKECGDCRKELFYYREEKKRFYTAAMLGESPSSKTDAAILGVCAPARARASFFTLMPVFLRKAAVPVALFAIAFISVGYVMMNVQNARELQAAAGKGAIQTTIDRSGAVSVPVETALTVDSAADSVAGTTMNYARTRGNLEGKGVIPVELKDK